MTIINVDAGQATAVTLPPGARFRVGGSVYGTSGHLTLPVLWQESDFVLICFGAGADPAGAGLLLGFGVGATFDITAFNANVTPDATLQTVFFSVTGDHYQVIGGQNANPVLDLLVGTPGTFHQLPVPAFMHYAAFSDAELGWPYAGPGRANPKWASSVTARQGYVSGPDSHLSTAPLSPNGYFDPVSVLRPGDPVFVWWVACSRQGRPVSDAILSVPGTRLDSASAYYPGYRDQRGMTGGLSVVGSVGVYPNVAHYDPSSHVVGVPIQATALGVCNWDLQANVVGSASYKPRGNAKLVGVTNSVVNPPPATLVAGGNIITVDGGTHKTSYRANRPLGDTYDSVHGWNPY